MNTSNQDIIKQSNIYINKLDFIDKIDKFKKSGIDIKKLTRFHYENLELNVDDILKLFNEQ